MPYEIRIRREAEADLSEAFQYYEECRQGLGHDFLLCIEESLSKISKSPSHYTTVHKTVRRAFIKRFPFGIFFVQEDSSIIVIAIMHARRNPRSWRIRT